MWNLLTSVRCYFGIAFGNVLLCVQWSVGFVDFVDVADLFDFVDFCALCWFLSDFTLRAVNVLRCVQESVDFVDVVDLMILLIYWFCGGMYVCMCWFGMSDVSLCWCADLLILWTLLIFADFVDFVDFCWFCWFCWFLWIVLILSDVTLCAVNVLRCGQ